MGSSEALTPAGLVTRTLEVTAEATLQTVDEEREIKFVDQSANEKLYPKGSLLKDRDHKAMRTWNAQMLVEKSVISSESFIFRYLMWKIDLPSMAHSTCIFSSATIRLSRPSASSPRRMKLATPLFLPLHGKPLVRIASVSGKNTSSIKTPSL